MKLTDDQTPVQWVLQNNIGVTANVNGITESDIMSRHTHSVGVKHNYEFVQGFYTRRAANRYLEANKHNLCDPRIYVDSLYRNKEMIAIRKVLMNNEEFAKLVDKEMYEHSRV
jgi:hypothetical protein